MTINYTNSNPSLFPRMDWHGKYLLPDTFILRMSKKWFCLNPNCGAIDSLKGYDYSGGPGVTVCTDCDRKSTLVEVEQSIDRDTLMKLSEVLPEHVSQLSYMVEQGELSVADLRNIANDCTDAVEPRAGTSRERDEKITDIISEYTN